MHGYFNGENVVYLENKSTMDTVVRNAAGRVVLQERYVYDGSVFTDRVDWTLHQYDDLGRETAVYRSNGTCRQTEWEDGSCCTTRTVTDEGGAVTVYTYDFLGRLTSQVKQGTETPTTPTVTTVFENAYNGDYRVATQTLSGSGVTSLVWTKTYDQAGRLVQEQDPAELTTAYEYGTTQGGGLKVTVAYPGDKTEVREYFADGQIKNVYGSAVVERHYEYAVTGEQETGYFRATDETVGPTDPEDGRPRVVTTTYDRLGRVMTEERPAYDNGTVTKTYYYYDPDETTPGLAGRLWKIADPSRAPTLYEYDQLGNLIRTGLDVSLNDALDYASTSSTDRIHETDAQYHQDGSYNWWFETKTWFYRDGEDRDSALARRLTARR